MRRTAPRCCGPAKARQCWRTDRWMYRSALADRKAAACIAADDSGPGRTDSVIPDGREGSIRLALGSAPRCENVEEEAADWIEVIDAER